MNQEQLQFLIENISSIAEYNVFQNIKTFVEKILPKGSTAEEKIAILNAWLDITLSDLSKRLEIEQK